MESDEGRVKFQFGFTPAHLDILQRHNLKPLPTAASSLRLADFIERGNRFQDGCAPEGRAELYRQACQAWVGRSVRVRNNYVDQRGTVCWIRPRAWNDLTEAQDKHAKYPDRCPAPSPFEAPITWRGSQNERFFGLEKLVIVE